MSLNVNVSIPFHLKESVNGSPGYSSIYNNATPGNDYADLELAEELNGPASLAKIQDTLGRTQGHINSAEYQHGKGSPARRGSVDDEFANDPAKDKTTLKDVFEVLQDSNKLIRAFVQGHGEGQDELLKVLQSIDQGIREMNLTQPPSSRQPQDSALPRSAYQRYSHREESAFGPHRHDCRENIALKNLEGRHIASQHGHVGRDQRVGDITFDHSICTIYDCSCSRTARDYSRDAT